MEGGLWIKIASDFLRAILKNKRQWGNALIIPRENNFQPRLTLKMCKWNQANTQMCKWNQDIFRHIKNLEVYLLCTRKQLQKERKKEMSFRTKENKQRKRHVIQKTGDPTQERHEGKCSGSWWRKNP